VLYFKCFFSHVSQDTIAHSFFCSFQFNFFSRWIFCSRASNFLNLFFVDLMPIPWISLYQEECDGRGCSSFSALNLRLDWRPPKKMGSYMTRMHVLQSAAACVPFLLFALLLFFLMWLVWGKSGAGGARIDKGDTWARRNLTHPRHAGLGTCICQSNWHGRWTWWGLYG